MSYVPIIVYSKDSMNHVNNIVYYLYNSFSNLHDKIELIIEKRIMQHDRNPQALLESIDYYNKLDVFCFVVVSEENNGLANFVDANTTVPVIYSPCHYNTKSFYDSPMMTFGPENTALTIVKLLGVLYGNDIGQLVREYQNNNRQKARIEDIVLGHEEFTVNEKWYEDKVTSKKNMDYLLTHTFKRKGKVRDIYESEEDGTVVLSASDRLSAFDRIICNIPYKGAVLNRISTWWFEQTKDLVPNHLLEVLNDTDIKVKKCTPILVEFVVRGYITGSSKTSMWKNYSEGCSSYCGHVLPRGLHKNQKLETPLVTPTTKGATDELISREEIIKRGILTEEQWNQCKEYALKLFNFGTDVASQNGLILVDTKYEFGFDGNGNIILIDEIHTADSSRYWFKHSYNERFNNGEHPEAIDKEIIRMWIKENYDPYDKSVHIHVPQDKKDLVMRRYIQLYEIITGQYFF
jgi:phosphoribosylaminoimidazole-succinocarboxamide synthase